MSMQSTREQLIRLLDDEDNKVVALSGKWGTGKSFIWEQLYNDSRNPRVKGALYASLFGLSDIGRLKLKLIQSAATILDNNPTLLEGAKQFVKSSVKVLEGVHKSFSAINDISLLLAPSVLREKLIVLDDIERKHDNLNIDELLGFIDEFTQRFDARFLLILNSDQLSHRQVWEKLREKVIDEEIRLTTSCDEAFQIASSLTPSPWSTPIAEAATKCGLTNIRIIRKIIKAVNCVFGKREHVSDAVLMRVIPSTVLLAAIHYKGIENGPDLGFVLDSGRATDWAHLWGSKEYKKTDEEKCQAQWRALITGLGIYSCDELELLVAEYLQSGLFDSSKVEAIIDNYEAEHEAMNAKYMVNIFLQKCFWEHQVTEPELLEEARDLVKSAHLLDAYTVTTFHDQLEDLDGGSSLAKEVLSLWLDSFEPQDIVNNNSLSIMFRRGVHPKIKDLLESVEEKAQADMNVLDTCKYIATNSGWNTRQEMALKLATVESFESAIRAAAPSDLQMIMAKMLEFTGSSKRYEQYFGSAMNNFVVACQRIIADPSVPRLTRILTHLFEEAKLGDLLV